MNRWSATLIVLAFVAGPLKGASPMNEQQARAQAATILMGDPYGATEAQVAEAIRDAELIADGTTLCGEMGKPVWSFHVVVEKPVTIRTALSMASYLSTQQAARSFAPTCRCWIDRPYQQMLRGLSTWHRAKRPEPIVARQAHQLHERPLNMKRLVRSAERG